MKEMYERTKLEITEFESEDVIVTSAIDNGQPVTNGNGRNELPFLSDNGVYM